MSITTEALRLACGTSMPAGMEGPGVSGMMDGGTMGGVMGPWMLVGWIVPLLVLIGLGALAVWAIRTLAGDSGGRSEDDALEVARERYARGEIDREEFRGIRSDLASG